MHIVYIGLGKMGIGMVERLREAGHVIAAHDPDPVARTRARATGVPVHDTLSDALAAHRAPRTVWLMVPHTAVESVLTTLAPLLTRDDTLIDGGNSPYRDTVRRARTLAELGVGMLDAGVSGGPSGARTGACIMVGGPRPLYERYAHLFRDLAVRNGVLYVGESGAGHFVKMVHNGIEYGMMQAIAEGFDLMRTSPYNLPLTAIAELYGHGSVIESRLIGWLRDGLVLYGEELAAVTGSAQASGEGTWTVETARTLGVPAAVIESAVHARNRSQQNPNYQGKLVSVMRNRFGGHGVSVPGA